MSGQPTNNDIKDGVQEKKFPGGILNLNNMGGKLFVGGFICLVILCIIFSFVNKDLNVNIASIILAFIALIPFGVTYWHSNNRANVNTKLSDYNTRVANKFKNLNKIRNPFNGMGAIIKTSYNDTMTAMSKFNKDQKERFVNVIDTNVENITKTIKGIKERLALVNTDNEERRKLYENLLRIREDLANEKGKADAANNNNLHISDKTNEEMENDAEKISEMVAEYGQSDNNPISLMANNDTEYRLIDNKPYILKGTSYPVFESTNIANVGKKYFSADGSREFYPEEYKHYENQYKNAPLGYTQQKIHAILEQSGRDNSRGNELTDQQQLLSQMTNANPHAANRASSQTNDQKKKYL